MEPLPYNDPGDCSPRHRETETENLPPENPQNNQVQQCCKIKIMCSYGGRILPRPLDNRLSYVGGDTKILVADRNIRLAGLLAKLNALCDSDCVSFKYQLPGEDLDALISVTNDDDLEHMVHEYERLYRVSQKSARIRIFFFPALKQNFNLPDRRLVPEEGKSDKERFIEALNTPPMAIVPAQSLALPPEAGIPNADILFDSEKQIALPEKGLLHPEKLEISPPDGRSDPLDQIQKHIQDVQWLRHEEQQGIYTKTNEDSFSPEKFSPAAVQGGVPYWIDSKFPGRAFPANIINSDRPVYFVTAPASAYHPPIWRPQPHLAFQMMQPEIYNHQNPHSLLPHSTAMAAAGYPLRVPETAKTAIAGGVDTAVAVVSEGGAYAQVAQDTPALRQVIYNAPGGVVGTPVQPAAQHQVVSGGLATDSQPAGALNPEPTAKLVEK